MNWFRSMAYFLSPGDQFRVVNSIKNNYPDRDWSKGGSYRVGLINILQSQDQNILGIIMRIAREPISRKKSMFKFSEHILR